MGGDACPIGPCQWAVARSVPVAVMVKVRENRHSPIKAPNTGCSWGQMYIAGSQYAGEGAWVILSHGLIMRHGE